MSSIIKEHAEQYWEDLGHVFHWEHLPDSCLEKQMMKTMVSLKEMNELAVCIAKIFPSFAKVAVVL